MNPTVKNLESPDLYHVGWIAALPLERTAALLMLDEEHGTPTNFDQRTDDKNSYSWGRIGEHNVVIASLQAGLYGIAQAATTAKSMLSSFPDIRVGLLVGIGAGIARPEKDRDIRLGDVVVSQPSETNGGVIQYSLVKAKENHLERKGFLNKPPTALLNTLGKLQAEHELPRRSLVAPFLEEIGKQYPEMGQYLYQGMENDKLFNSTDRHLGGSDCSRCDKAYQAIRRSSRRSTAPKIHYGTIASGDILIKDGVFRDWIVEQLQLEDCLCFEMEAAGLMNDFPCLVIRGICDYGDTHKNDRWQRYAAAAAAAYAKEFLRYIPGKEIEKAQKATDILNRGPQQTESHGSVGYPQSAYGSLSPQLEAASIQAVSQMSTAITQLCREMGHLVYQLERNQNDITCCAACCPRYENDNKDHSTKQGRVSSPQEVSGCPNSNMEKLTCFKKTPKGFK